MPHPGMVGRWAPPHTPRHLGRAVMNDKPTLLLTGLLALVVFAPSSAVAQEAAVVAPAVSGTTSSNVAPAVSDTTSANAAPDTPPPAAHDSADALAPNTSAEATQPNTPTDAAVEQASELTPVGVAVPANSEPSGLFTLTISGGLSLGNYEAGINWALLQNRRASGGKLLAATGASAGAINALVSAVAWCVVDDDSTVENNLFRNVWLPVGFTEMLPYDLDKYDDDDLLMSRVESHKKARERLKRFVATHSFVEGCQVEVAFTVTGQKAFYQRAGQLKAPSNYYVVPLTMTVVGGKLVFVPNQSYVDDEDHPHALALVDRCKATTEQPFAACEGVGKYTGAGSLSLDSVVDVVVASSAFPLAFGPVPLKYRRPADPECQSDDPDQACMMYFSDGGVFDNVPLRLAKALVPKSIEPRSVENVYFDPDIRRDNLTTGDCSDKQPEHIKEDAQAMGATEAEAEELARRSAEESERETGPLRRTWQIYLRALSTARTRVLFETIRDEDICPRLPSRFAPLTGDTLGSFGAWLHPLFREYDYLAGVYDALMLPPEEGDMPGGDFEARLMQLPFSDRDGGHAYQFLLDFRSLERTWLTDPAKTLAVLSQRAQAGKLRDLQGLRYVMFTHHLKRGRPRAAGGAAFCDSERPLSELVRQLAVVDFPIDRESSEFLHAARDRPDFFWAAFASRGIRRVKSLEEDHVIQGIGDAAHSVTYPFDPRRRFDFKLDAQVRVGPEYRQWQALAGVSWISETGTWQVRPGITLSALSAARGEVRVGGHLDTTLAINVPIALWLQAEGAAGLESKQPRAGLIFGVQAFDLLRLGAAGHYWLGTGDDAWRRRWLFGDKPYELAVVVALRLDTIATAL